MTAVQGAELLGLGVSTIAQELGWDEDTDLDPRNEIMNATNVDMIEDAIEAVDVVVLQWREDDDGVVGNLVDAMKDLAPTGFTQLLAPKADRLGYVSLNDLTEGTVTADLPLTNSASVSPEWQAYKVVRPKGIARR